MALSRDPATINKILAAVKCITITQVCSIFPDKSQNAIRYILSQLYHQNYISFIENNYIVPYRKESISRESILCAWVMLCQDEEADIGIDVNNSMELEMIGSTEYPVQFMYVHKNVLYDVIYIYNENIANLLYVQRDVLNRTTEEGLASYRLIIVIEDENLIDQIAAIKLSIPNIIAVVHAKSDLYMIPEIDFYQ